jgi:maltose alpha-D-glucosyltransferase/alpha-amylase
MGESKIKNTIQPTLNIEWNDLFNNDRYCHQLENQILPSYLQKCRWFGGKSRLVSAVKIYQNIPIQTASNYVHFLLLKVRYPDGPTEIYTLPLAFVNEKHFQAPSQAVLCRIENPVNSGYIIDAIYDEDFRNALPNLFYRSTEIRGNHYPLIAKSNSALKDTAAEFGVSKVLNSDQSNSAILYGNKYFLKLFRKVEYITNPDYEIVGYLTEQNNFHQLPKLAGSISLQHPEKKPMLMMMLQEQVINQGDAWKYFTDEFKVFLERVIELDYHTKPLPIKPHTLALNFEQTPTELRQMMGEEIYQKAALLGRRTAEMHLALGANSGNSDFEPEPIDEIFQKQLLQNINHLVDTRFSMLETNLEKIGGKLKDDAIDMISRKERVKNFFATVLTREMKGERIRIHGDYHLGQVLMTNSDFYILDFEGEPDKLHFERRLKYPPLKDVAGMMRSFRYAAYSVIFTEYASQPLLAEKLMVVADVWYHYVSRFYLGEYIKHTAGSNILPNEEKINDLLQVYSFKKAIYELGYEINNRPEWTVIPLQSLVKFVRHYLDA